MDQLRSLVDIRRPSGLTRLITFSAAAGLLVFLLIAALVSCGPAPRPQTPTPPPFNQAAAQALCERIWQTELQRAIDPGGLAGCLGELRAGASEAQVTANVRASEEYKALHAPRPPEPERTASIHGRLRVQGDGFVNDRGGFKFLGTSEFDLLWLTLHGKVAEVRSRLSAVPPAVRVVRVLGSASIMFRLSPDDAGYDSALRTLLAETGSRGIYVELCVFADAQLVFPRDSDRQRVLDHLAATFGKEPGIVWEIANEAFKNGWSEADDPKLLALADRLAARLGHRDFIVSDPRDGDDPDASAETTAAEIAIARHANVISLHPSRKGGSAPDGDRLRRWVDHLEGITDTVAAVRRATGRNVVAVITEPMGNASRCSSSRECDPDAAVFGGVTGMFSAAGYIYHRIASQDPATPGLADLAAIVEQLPASGCVYRNDHNGGATDGFTWKGKVRSYLCGSKGFVLAYGLDTVGTETWVHGWHPVETLYSSPAHESGAFARSKGKVYRVAK